MTPQSLGIMLETLCCYFELSKPILRMRQTHGGGRYSWKYRKRNGRVTRHTYRRAIYVPLKGGKSEATMIHEFAHYLHHARKGFLGDIDHGPAFRRALTDVATAWYGDPHHYPWDNEYKSLAKLGPILD